MKENERYLVSACLLGLPCRYDGQAKDYPAIWALAKEADLIPVCPEQLGGLATPRLPAERQGEKVLRQDGKDLTAQFQKGAQATLALGQGLGIHQAILKSRSPSCGSKSIYDGSFTQTLIPGQGITAELLAQAGFTLYREEDFIIS